ncbi:hypothetical protein ABZ322_18035, partial [Streptomyces sp. NPDC006129]
MPPRTTDSTPERRDDRPQPTEPEGGALTEGESRAAETVEGGDSGAGSEPHGGIDPTDADAADVDRRVAAMRRAADGGRRWRAAHLAGCAALLAVALTGGAVA